jgi:hypothetical protein
VYDYSQFRVGDFVEADTDPNMSAPCFGQLSRVAENACDLLIYRDTGAYPLHSCWHVDDERAQDPGRFREAQELWIDDDTQAVQMGVFRLTRNQEILNALPRKIQALETSIEAIVIRITAMESKTVTPQAPKRGRPRKIQPAKPPAEPVLR